MSGYTELYQTAFYYDIVFRRDVSPEADFILDAIRYYGGPEHPEILELACGPAYHARALAKKGIKVIGLDNSSEMIQFGRDRARDDGVEIEFVLGDMCDFKLKQPVDAVITLCNGLLALKENANYVKHFRSVAKNLKPNGIYIVDFVNPRDCSFDDYGDYEFTGADNGTSVRLKWGVNEPKFDLVTGIALVEIEMKVRENGSEKTIRDHGFERILFPQEVTLLTELSGTLKVVGWHGNFNIHQPFDNSPGTERMIGVFKKK